ncbi:MAG: chemotaxis protein CheW [Turneriella sp.]|nr:chemotaxis protein CheW [Leptospiraceae bacterium]MCX7633565.1 chemotaxis protein CheW [Turneriella sp.]
MHEEEKFILIRVGSEHYGVPIAAVEEVVRYQAPQRIPHSPAHILGMVSVRGTILPVLGLREWFALEPKAADGETRIVIIRHGQKLMGLVCDSAERVVTVKSQNIEQTPETIAQKNRTGIEAVARLAEQDLIFFILSPQFLITENAGS